MCFKLLNVSAGLRNPTTNQKYPANSGAMVRVWQWWRIKDVHEMKTSYNLYICKVESRYCSMVKCTVLKNPSNTTAVTHIYHSHTHWDAVSRMFSTTLYTFRCRFRSLMSEPEVTVVRKKVPKMAWGRTFERNQTQMGTCLVLGDTRWWNYESLLFYNCTVYS